MILPSDKIKRGKKLMLRVEVIEDYKSNCYVRIRLPSGEERDFHLNYFQSPELKPYFSWED